MESSTQPGGVGLGGPSGALAFAIDDRTWDVLCELVDEVLFHERLFPVLAMLPYLILAPDLGDAITDLVLNGMELDG